MFNESLQGIATPLESLDRYRGFLTEGGLIVVSLFKNPVTEANGPRLARFLTAECVRGRYSLIDEAFHWRRYTSHHADPVEMWSHVGIFVGHGTMMLAWWRCYQLGYPGVREALAAWGYG